MANVMALTGTPRINSIGNPVHENWQTGDVLITPSGDVIMINPGVGELGFVDGDTTPDVSGANDYFTQNSGLTTITTLDGGTAGQRVRLRIADPNTIISGALTRTGRAIVCIAGIDHFEWVYDGVNWYQVAGSVGMGAGPFPVEPKDQIGDWIASSVTTFTDVDVSDDGVRKGASAVLIGWTGQSSATLSGLSVRQNGSSGGNCVAVLQVLNVTFCAQFIVHLDDNAIFEAAFGAAWTTVANNAYVQGYWI